MTKNQNILITGGAGYIGSHTANRLSDAGHRIVVLDDLSNAPGDAVPEAVFFTEGDIGDSKLVTGLIHEHEINAVFHLAASVSVAESVIDPWLYYFNNTLKSHAFITACIGAGIENFIFSSSAAVYGAAGTTPVAEDHPAVPLNPYGRSKLMTEWMLADLSATTPLRYLTFRYFNVAGAALDGRAGQRSKGTTHLVQAAVDAALGRREAITVFGNDYDTPDGTCIRDFVHVQDIADAHEAALHYLVDGGPSVALNCGSGRSYSVNEVLDAVERVSGTSLKRIVGPRRGGDAPSLTCSNQRILDVLGWRPKVSDIDTIVGTSYSWARGLDCCPATARD